MNAVELDQVVTEVADRMSAAMDGAPMTVQHRNVVVAVFAGTDLPGHDVLQMLSDQINHNLPKVPQVGGLAVMQGVALNTFLIGFECGRRSA